MRRSILVLMAAAACAVWAAGPASAAAASWAIQATPSPAGATSPSLNGVSCPSATNCVAVGSDSNAETGTSQTLAEHWTGSAWVVQATPALSGSLDANLSGVECPSVTSCIAVGQNTGSSDLGTALAEHWNGSTWTNMNAPNPAAAAAGSALSGISCISATCMAVGHQLISGGEQQPLAEHWNGSAWTVQATPIPSGSVESSLSSVSCVSATNCTAVGVSSGSSYLTLLVEHWNGSTWAVQDVPNPDGAQPATDSVSFLKSVSCSSATSCTAVGFFNPTGGTAEQLLAEHWNGSTWAIQKTASPAGANEDSFDGVSCRSATACTATGFAGHTIDTTSSTLAEQWNGSTWTIESTPNAAGSDSNIFSGVSCSAVATCTAVGFSSDGGLAERS